jgi:hypothetical protein
MPKVREEFARSQSGVPKVREEFARSQSGMPKVREECVRPAAARLHGDFSGDMMKTELPMRSRGAAGEAEALAHRGDDTLLTPDP